VAPHQAPVIGAGGAKGTAAQGSAAPHGTAVPNDARTRSLWAMSFECLALRAMAAWITGSRSRSISFIASLSVARSSSLSDDETRIGALMLTTSVLNETESATLKKFSFWRISFVFVSVAITFSM